MAIKIAAFMTVFKNRKTDEEKNEMIKKHLKNEYVPYEKKADIAKAIINNSYWKKLMNYCKSKKSYFQVEQSKEQK